MSADNYSWTNRIIGTNVGAYVINHLIGEGGMAAVFEATHARLGNKVAIKVLRPEFAANHDIREKFRKEAERMASLNHRNIPRVYDFDEQPDRLSIIMELLRGEDLNKRIRRAGALNDDEITFIFEQILSALQYAHESGIVHRDIKPSNIYILPGNEIRILDFGISKLFGEGEDGTRTGIQIGTPVYMSPEQVKGDRSIDHRSDIYSLGVTLYCAVKGRPPYNKNTLSDFDIYQKIVFEILPDVDDYTPFGHLIKKACNKDRQQRFQTCAEWLEQFSHPNFDPIPPTWKEETDEEEQKQEHEHEEPWHYPETEKTFFEKFKVPILLLLGSIVMFGFYKFIYPRKTEPPVVDISPDSTSYQDSGYISNTNVDTPTNPTESPSDERVYEVGELANSPSIDPGCLKYDDKVIQNSSDEMIELQVGFRVNSDATITDIEIQSTEEYEALSSEQKYLVKNQIEKSLISISGNSLCITSATNNGYRVHAKHVESFSFPKLDNVEKVEF